ncbi:MAG TPA: hypothetical protein ENN91_05430 [Firmicutes bacterium]|nr:hypothetical protein [Bacillota bacterium]
MPETLVLTLFILAGLVYLFLMNDPQAKPISKPIPAAILAVYFLSRLNLPMALVYILAGIGDYLLIFPARLIRGMLAFAAAYTILNAVTFFYFSPLYLLIAVPMAAVLLLLRKGLVKKRIFYPLIAYTALVILVLLVNAMGHLFHGGSTSTGLGLLLLALSDIFIGIRFSRPFTHISYIVIITYFAGLALVSGL